MMGKIRLRYSFVSKLDFATISSIFRPKLTATCKEHAFYPPNLPIVNISKKKKLTKIHQHHFHLQSPSSTSHPPPISIINTISTFNLHHKHRALSSTPPPPPFSIIYTTFTSIINTTSTTDLHHQTPPPPSISTLHHPHHLHHRSPSSTTFTFGLHPPSSTPPPPSISHNTH
ncbi:hypothetical protein LguiB_007664 [Lonicera macranthoides]